MAICNILQMVWIIYYHLVFFVLIWYIFSGLGIRHQEKSGNPGPNLTFSAPRVTKLKQLDGFRVVNHRNLRTRRRMHLYMQDDQNGQK
jgi:hypothetical protein